MIVQIRGNFHFLIQSLTTLRDVFSSNIEVFCKRVILKNFAEFSGKHLRWKKETRTQVFSRAFCKIFKSNFFVEHLCLYLLAGGAY